MKPSPNQAVSWVLMAAYAYYHLDTTILTDEDYDAAFRLIQANYDTIDHPHLHLIPKGEKSTTLFNVDFPTTTKWACKRFIADRKSPNDMLTGL